MVLGFFIKGLLMWHSDSNLVVIQESPKLIEMRTSAPSSPGFKLDGPENLSIIRLLDA